MIDFSVVESEVEPPRIKRILATPCASGVQER